LDKFNKNFFNRPKEEVVEEFTRRINTFLGPNQVGVEHIEALHALGYLPIEIKALPEGSICPIGVPALTIVNTLPEFFWITNYLETLMSSTLWLPMTSATSARLYKKRLMEHAIKTGFDKQPGLDFLCHDFSMRGMAGIEAAIMSGMGHLTSFTGSETIPALEAVEEYYHADADSELIAGTVPATEHSVACSCSINVDVQEVILDDNDQIIGYITSDGNKVVL
jgi:nicotinamide phosphoribosyltransferase